MSAASNANQSPAHDPNLIGAVRPESLAFLRELLDTPSPSGFERAGQRVWLSYVRPFARATWNDAYGNCFAAVGPEGDGVPTLAICGHADEIGLMVNHFDDKGFVYCKAIGGIDAGSIVGKRVRFMSSVAGVEKPVLGLIGATAIHLQDKSSEGKVRKIHELFVDIGATSADEAKARLAIGDAGVFLDGFMQLSDDLVVARALDNRIGTWIAAEALRLVAAASSVALVAAPLRAACSRRSLPQSPAAVSCSRLAPSLGAAVSTDGSVPLWQRGHVLRVGPCTDSCTGQLCMREGDRQNARAR